jgi:hypothetical protein
MFRGRYFVSEQLLKKTVTPHAHTRHSMKIGQCRWSRDRHPRRAQFSVWLATCALVSVHSLGNSVEPTPSAMQQRQILSVRLDSVEVEKQTLRRSGMDLGDLEALSRAIKDSIALLRNEFAVLKPAVSEARPSLLYRIPLLLKNSLSTVKPTNAFDWVIVIVGSVAVISGIALLFGFIHKLFRRKPAKKPVKAAVAKPPTYSPQYRHPAPASEKKEVADIDNDGLESLRKRMGLDINGRERPKSAPAPLVSQPAPVPRKSAVAGKDDLRHAVIAAAQEGLDVHAIAKKCQVSVDQVNLILRIAGRAS